MRQERVQVIEKGAIWGRQRTGEVTSYYRVVLLVCICLALVFFLAFVFVVFAFRVSGVWDSSMQDSQDVVCSVGTDQKKYLYWFHLQNLYLIYSFVVFAFRVSGVWV